jgi:hypothetical protein
VARQLAWRSWLGLELGLVLGLGLGLGADVRVGVRVRVRLEVRVRARAPSLTNPIPSRSGGARRVDGRRRGV